MESWFGHTVPAIAHATVRQMASSSSSDVWTLQVKIRGYRIELAEVEHALLRDNSVEDAVVLTRQLEGKDTELVSFVTLQSRHKNDGEENQVPSETGANDDLEISQEQREKAEAHLRAVLQVALPSYMIPARITVLDKMPLNPNGKVDRRALAALSLGPELARGPRAIVPPRNSTERALCEEFTHVLGVEVGITDNFFDLGGHSLMATRLASRINQRLNTLITVRGSSPVRQWLTWPRWSAKSLGGNHLHTHSGRPGSTVRLNSHLRRVVSGLCDQLYPESAWYLIPLATRLRGPLVRCA